MVKSCSYDMFVGPETQRGGAYQRRDAEVEGSQGIFRCNPNRRAVPLIRRFVTEIAIRDAKFDRVLNVLDRRAADISKSGTEHFMALYDLSQTPLERCNIQRARDMKNGWYVVAA